MAEVTQAETLQYRYPSLPEGGFARDMSFRGGSTPGEPVPEFELRTSGGRPVTRKELAGSPALITFGSLTCPMTRAAAPVLERLHKAFGGAVRFVTVYVREAHPGDLVGQAQTLDEKVELAKRLIERDGIGWTVAVDDIDGPFHQAMGGHPNAAFLLDAEGRVAFRALWSSDEAGLRSGLEAVASNAELVRRESRRRLAPTLAGIGVMDETLRAAGPRARREALQRAPYRYGLSKLAALYKPLPPAGRGAAAVGTVALAIAGVAALFARAGRRR